MGVVGDARVGAAGVWSNVSHGLSDDTDMSQFMLFKLSNR